ncbi:cell division protein FtsQ/DivIB [Lysobacter brunescens]|uniref:Cell division protein FtsQ n=1 Tax=Lysobacter brunescens TaxID=262323 RepID=A0ABW2Y7F5_9GAMM
MNAFLRLVAWLLALALVTLPVVAVIQGWVGAERWPLRTLRVVGDLERVDAARLRATVMPYAHRGFFAVRLEDAQAAVAKLPWVESAEVRKQWPDVLIVRVEEHRPFAWWGEDQLLSERGRFFPSADVAVPKGLPRFEGPVSRSSDLVALYNEARALFAPMGIDVQALRLDARGSWSMTLSNGAELLLGRDDARLRLARFARLLPQLQAQDPRTLARADLRYTNGFALTWREADAPGKTIGTPASAVPGVEPNAAPQQANPAGNTARVAHLKTFPMFHFRSTALPT